MKTLVYSLLLVAVVASCTVKDSRRDTGRERISFNEGWRFSLDADSTCISPAFDDKSWRALSVPHDWSIEGTFAENHPAGVGGGALPGGCGWYRKTFRVDSRSAVRHSIAFDGVYWNSDVWVNGKHLGHRPNGYISFSYDLTPHLVADADNVIVVKVDNRQQPNSRWYSGSGIYRNVWLMRTGNVHIDNWGPYVTTPSVSTDSAQFAVRTTVVNEGEDAVEVTVETVVSDASGREVTETSAVINVDAKRSAEAMQTLTLSQPNLWSVENPNLYSVRSRLLRDGEIIDEFVTRTGIRTFAFEKKEGFSLNGRPMKILGVCNHHDLGALGAAVNKRAIERQLQLLKSMGVNGIRTSHNPPAPELLDLCDEMGFVVMDEMFDMWKKKKSAYDYSQYWDEWHARDLRDFVLRDRNHPSVIIWSIGNEILEQWDSTGATIATELAGIVRDLDNTRPITTGNNDPQPYNHIIRSGALDLIGYNYKHADYADFPNRFPGKKFIATETTSALATRGHYDMPSDSIRRWPIRWDIPFTEGNKDNTVSSYDNVSAPWGSTHEETWKVMKKHPFLSGMFIWTGFDYLGEPTPYGWPSRSSYFGVIDLAGFPKDSYYMYQSEWTSTPVLHVFPHWNWKDGDVVDVWSYYNLADEVELFLNGVSQGVRRKGVDDLHVMWKIRYAPGVLKAVARKDGKEMMTREVKTAGAPSAIRLEADRSEIAADGYDLSFVTVTILDKDGNVVPDASNVIEFELKGDAYIAAVDNGDPVSHESFQSTKRKAFNGKALVIVRASRNAGEVVLTAQSAGLSGGETKIRMK